MSSEFEKANELFVDDCFEEALEYFNKAIQKEEKDEYYVNRSACLEKLGKFKEALNDANKAISLNSNNSKAYFRKGISLFELCDFEGSKESLEKAIQLNPSQSSWGKWLKKANAEIQEKKEKNPQNNSNNNSNNNNNTSSTTTSVVPSSNKVRQEWYQTSSHVIITLFVKNVKKEDLSVNFGEQEVSINLKLGEGREYVQDTKLLAKIITEESSSHFYSTKVEIKMKKRQEAKWDSLEWKDQSILRNWDSASQSLPPSYPSSSKKKVDWDKIKEEEEDLKGEDALNKVFRDIFKNGTEEQQRAMMKSFQESGGTVLSTNWEDIGSRKVEGTPPEGLVMKNWKDI